MEGFARQKSAEEQKCKRAKVWKKIF